MRALLGLMVMLAWIGPRAAFAEGTPFIALGTSARPLVQMQAGDSGAVRSASLFSGVAEGGLFAPLPPRLKAVPQGGVVFNPGSGDWQASAIRDLIAQAEAGRAGYDAVQHGARIKPRLPPTAMTLRQIYDWIDRTPKQPHAIGRYQFIPATLRRLVRAEGLPLDTRFSRSVQDRLADRLLMEAGFEEARRGTLSRRSFMRNLAKIWAGLPLPSGASYYHGFAGNKATMSWKHFDSAMQRILPG